MNSRSSVDVTPSLGYIDSQMSEPISDSLRNAFDAWTEFPRRRHLAVILLLMATLAARYHIAVFSPVPREDEGVYFHAFAAAAAGESPYNGAYYYTSAFALLCARGVEHLGVPAMLAILRSLNLLGMALCAWISAAWLPWSFSRRVLAAVLYVALAPAVALGVLWCNLSFLVIGMLLAGLLLWRRRQIIAALLLGLSLLIKPIGPVAIGALFIHRPDPPSRRHMAVAGAALILAVAVLLPLPWFGEMLAIEGKPYNARNATLQHIFYCFGLPVGSMTIALAVAAATAVLGRARSWTRESLLALASVAGVLALPVVWAHTLLLVLPLQVMGLVTAFARRETLPPNAGPNAGPLRRYETALVVLAVLSIQFCEGLGGIERWPFPLQGLAALPATLAPAALLTYLLKVTDI